MDLLAHIFAVALAFIAVLTFAAMVWAGQHQS
jgi:hypothetical protein